MALGRKTAKDVGGVLQRTVVKWIALYASGSVADRTGDGAGGGSAGRGNGAGSVRDGSRRTFRVARGVHQPDARRRNPAAASSHLRQDVESCVAAVGISPHGSSPSTVRRLSARDRRQSGFATLNGRVPADFVVQEGFDTYSRRAGAQRRSSGGIPSRRCPGRTLSSWVRRRRARSTSSLTPIVPEPAPAVTTER